MNNMTSLMSHYLEHPNLKPSEALESWNGMMSSGHSAAMNPTPIINQPTPNMSHPNIQQIRQPGPGQIVSQNHQFMSPALQNQLLPNGINGSPHYSHTPSPASHAMIKQQSTSSHTASVNTSPNMATKRRRSTTKTEMDDGSGDMNGATKVKQSPRVVGNKRMKANN